MSDPIKNRKSTLACLITGAVLGGILFLLIAFIITQLGEAFESQQRVRNSLATLFFDYPSLIFTIPLHSAGYTLPSHILFFAVFSVYVTAGALINLIWTKIRSS